jgi:hypothetical protein
MKMDNYITTQADLEQLIERYFDGETTVKEEQMLCDVLADCSWSSEAIDDARFTLGYFVAHKQQGHRPATVANRSRIMAIAASVAVLLTVGLGLHWQQHQANNVCVAYVNGKAIHNEQEVFKLMQSDLNDMGNATQGLAEQLSSLGDAIELDI